MKLPEQKKTSREENLIPLINIVFLILIFFLVAATIRPFTAPDITPAEAQISEKKEPINFSLMIDKNGVMQFDGNPVEVEELSQNAAARPDKPTLTIVADKDLPAKKLLALVAGLNADVFASINLVTKEVRQ